MNTLAILGGSGLYGIDQIDPVISHDINTPYGKPSAPIIEAQIEHPQNPAGHTSTRLLFLARHGQNHQIPPHQINYRANICALKMLGAHQLVSLCAVGSMREDIIPGDVVIVDQYVDWTKGRSSTFFEDGIVAHVSLAEPACVQLANSAQHALCAIKNSVRGTFTVHEQGTYLCMHGPQFSTRAESQLYRNWGVHVIGMTGATEAKLAREAQLPYLTLAFATDFDCWHAEEANVTVQSVLAIMKDNASLAQELIKIIPSFLSDSQQSEASSALQYALLSHAPHSAEVIRRMHWLLPGLT